MSLPWAAATLTLLLAAGCNSEPDVTGSGSTGLETGDSQTSATTKNPTGDDPTGGEPTGGEPDPPATREDCEDYLVCLSATAPELLPTAQMGYGENGSCWKGTPKEAQQCIDACQVGLEKYHDIFPNEPKCDLCTVDADCPASDTCEAGGCRPKTCGDGLVQDGEICDGAYCDDDCRGAAACTPLNNVGCGDNQYCAIEADGDEVCVSIDPGTVLQEEGGRCNADPNEICAPGLKCMDKQQFSQCPTPFCCIRYCDTNAPSEDCPGDSFCVSYDFIFDVNLYASELRDYLGVCYHWEE